MTSINQTNFDKQTENQGGQYQALALQILQSDIDQMEYHWNENPMCDFYSKNAICSSLKRLIRRNVGSLRLIADESSASVRIGDTIQPMSHQISNWFQNANRGLSVKPISSIIWLPNKLISRQLLKEIRSKRTRFY